MRIVIIIAQKDFRDEELFDTKAVLEQNGVDVKVAAPTLEIAKGKLGGTIEPDLIIDEIEVGKFNAIVFVGGPGAYQFIDDPKIHELAKQFYNAGKLTAAICIAPAILAKAGLLKGKKATIFNSSEDYLKEAGAVYTESDLEIDGNIITASGPAVASRFGQEIVEALKK